MTKVIEGIEAVIFDIDGTRIDSALNTEGAVVARLEDCATVALGVLGYFSGQTPNGQTARCCKSP